MTLHPIQPRVSYLPQFGKKHRRAHASHILDRNLPAPAHINFPIAAVDVGSNSIKTLVRKANGKVVLKRYDVYLGESVGRSGRIEPAYEAKLRTVFADIARDLFKNHGVKPNHVKAVATSALREAKNGPEMIAIAQKLGIPLEAINGLQEAELLYGSTLEGLNIPADQKTIVVETGGGSMELAYGLGPQQFQRNLSSVSPVGSARLNIEDAYNSLQLQDARCYVRDKLEFTISEQQIREARGRKAYITNYWYLRPVAKDDVLTRDEIQQSLQPRGLAQLARAYEGTNVTVHNMAGMLIILDETMRILGVDKIKLGTEGGLKFALLQSLIRDLSS